MATFRERLRAFLNPDALNVRDRPKPGLDRFSRPSGGKRARKSVDQTYTGNLLGQWGILPRPRHERDWHARDLDDQTLARTNIANLVVMLSDLSPDVSKALWDFLRYCNPGWEIRAFHPDPDSDEIHPQAQAAVDDFVGMLDDNYGAADVVWGQLFITAFWRGALAGELVLGRNGRTPVDFVVLDPYQIDFRRRPDGARGKVWKPGQRVDGDRWIDLDIPTFSYVPLDPAPDDPYGRAPVSAGIFSAIFLLGLLHDLRRVISQQGYPRLDLEVDLDALMRAVPDLADDPDAFRSWVNDTIDEVAEQYAALEADDAYVHTSTVRVNGAVGAVDASSLGAVEGVIRAVERMITRGLKSLPLLMGSNEAVSETHANRQVEVYTAAIRTTQHRAEQMIERLLRVALRAQGINARVKFRFAELRASERMQDAQAEALEIANARALYDNGWISQDDAAQMITGRPADAPAPRDPALGLGPGNSVLPGGDALDEDANQANFDTAVQLRRAVEALVGWVDDDVA